MLLSLALGLLVFIIWKFIEIAIKYLTVLKYGESHIGTVVSVKKPTFISFWPSSLTTVDGGQFNTTGRHAVVITIDDVVNSKQYKLWGIFHSIPGNISDKLPIKVGNLENGEIVLDDSKARNAFLIHTTVWCTVFLGSAVGAIIGAGVYR